MGNEYSFKIEKKDYTLNLNNFANGLTLKELELADDKYKKLIALFDGNNDNKITREEVQKLLFNIDNNKNEEITYKEITKFGKNNNFTKDDILEVLKKLAEYTQQVINLNTDKDGTQIITKQNGIVEKRYKDGKKDVTTKKDGVEATEHYDKDGEITGKTEVRKEKDKTTTTEFNAQNKKTKETLVEGNKTTVTEFNDNEESVKQIITEDDVKTTITKNREGKEVKVVENTKNNTSETFVDDQKTQSKDANGNVTTYTDGIETTTSANRKTITKKEGTRTTITTELENGKTETITDSETSKSVTKTYMKNKDNYVLIQEKVGNHVMKFDAQGNITGIIVQNAESVQKLLQAFGVKPTDDNIKKLLDANRNKVKTFTTLSGKNIQGFIVGEEIVIPRDLLGDDFDAEKFAGIQAGRKDSAGTIGDYNADAARRKAAEAAAAEEAEEAVTKQQQAVLTGNDLTPKEKKELETLAQSFYDIADNNRGYGADGSIAQMRNFVKEKLTDQNIVQFLDTYNDNVKSYGKGRDTSWIDTILSEYGGNQELLLNEIFAKLEAAAEIAGVDRTTIDDCKKMLENVLENEFHKASPYRNTMIAPFNTLISAIRLSKAGVTVGENEETDLISSFTASFDNSVSGEISDGAKLAAIDFYNIADNNHGATSHNLMTALIKTRIGIGEEKVDIVEFITAYNNAGVRHGDENIVDTILSEHGDGGYDVIDVLVNKLIEKANSIGVPERFLDEAKADLEKDKANKNLKEHERYMNYINELIDLIGGVSVGATNEWKEARGQDTWGISHIADFVTSGGGLYGHTKGEMQALLAKHEITLEALKEQEYIMNTDTKTLAEKAAAREEFKRLYKETFGVEFNPALVKARDDMQQRVAIVGFANALLDPVEKALAENSVEGMVAILEQCKTPVTKDGDQNVYLAEEIKAHVDIMMGADSSISVDEAYKSVLEGFKETLMQQKNEALAGQEYEDMVSSLEQLNSATYGSTDLGKVLAQYNANQKQAEMWTQAGVDILATVATSWIPGLGEAAALKAVATFGKLAKTAKIAGKVAKANRLRKVVTMYEKTAKGFRTVKAARTGKAFKGTKKTIVVANKATQIFTKAANSFVAVTTVHAIEGGISGNNNWEKNIEAGWNFAKFAGVAGTADAVIGGIATYFGVSTTLAGKAVSFVLEQCLNLSYVGLETVQNYVKEQRKLDPDWNPKDHQEEISEVLFSDEAAINAVIMLSMSLISHSVSGARGKGKGKPEMGLVKSAGEKPVEQMTTTELEAEYTRLRENLGKKAKDGSPDAMRLQDIEAELFSKRGYKPDADGILKPDMPPREVLSREIDAVDLAGHGFRTTRSGRQGKANELFDKIKADYEAGKISKQEAYTLLDNLSHKMANNGLDVANVDAFKAQITGTQPAAPAQPEAVNPEVLGLQAQSPAAHTEITPKFIIRKSGGTLHGQKIEAQIKKMMENANTKEELVAIKNEITRTLQKSANGNLIVKNGQLCDASGSIDRNVSKIILETIEELDKRICLAE